ncbi:MAG: metallophosphoesterase family protein, partial [Minisyncoccia bacterium]
VEVPEGDVFVHAGDLTFDGSLGEIGQELELIAELPHKHKVIIAGNHDWCFDNINRKRVEKDCKNLGITYLRDEEVVIDGVRFYGSPWQPRFFDWAFNVDRGPKLAEIWAKIPDDTQVLITHGPPRGIGDPTYRDGRVGCEDLLVRVKQLPKLLVHVFGHIHLGYGGHREHGIKFVNASSCNERYNPVNPPIVVDL